MSYRSIKRVLGETSLERKCRFLFGLCLLLLIGGAFWRVDRIAEDLVKETTRRIGRDWAKMALLSKHWERWETDEKKIGFRNEMSNDLLNENYDLKTLVLEKVDLYLIPENQPPEGSDERKLLLDLKARWLAQMAAQLQHPAPQPPTTSEPATQANELTPVFAELVQLDSADKKYSYYQPIDWKASCNHCHEKPGANRAETPFLVMRVDMAYEATRRAINGTRAILFSVAILTVFVAMVALYLIVRYVIVKPLTHLRDVSDEISRGNSALRAEINTNDEFADLAASFNRMLRHLTDAQSELRQANATLDGKVDELAQLNMRLYEMNRLKDDFLANMSHELRTPLNSIIGFSEVLSGIDSLNEKQKRYAQNIQKSGRVLLDMINDILDLAKLEAGKMDLRPSEFRVDVVVGAQCDMVRSLTEMKNIDLSVNVDPDVPPLFQDQGKVQQILTNLLSNAIKFTPEGGRIQVTARPSENGRLELTVSDTGVGIAEEDREIIFEKFRQSKSVLGKDGLTREYSGTGLGLSIVKELCKLLGGEIAFTSELGKGSTFRVALPWSVTPQTLKDSRIAAKLEELSRPKRTDFPRAEERLEAAAVR